MGKWSSFKNKLPKWEGEPIADSYREHCDKLRAELATKNNVDLGRAYNEIRAEKEAKEAEASLLGAELQTVTQLLIERAEEEGLTSLPLENGFNYLIVDVPHASTADKAKCREWFIENDQIEILAPHPSTLDAIVKGKLEAGADPDAVAQEMGVKIFMKTMLQRRKH